MRKFFATVTMMTTAGCATQGVNSFSYTPGELSAVKNEKTVARPQAVVWDELVRELSKSFFVINNIERESRIINVSFNSNSPAEYVDCGRTHRTYTEGDKREDFDYAVAERTTYKIAGDKQPHPAMRSYAVINREPTLEGRANIYVAPDATDLGKTVVSVNTRYILSVRVRGEGIVQHAQGNIINRTHLPEQNQSHIFNTNKASTTTGGAVSVVCAGLGRLETDILKMVR
jgi:hypothetical protein